MSPPADLPIDPLIGTQLDGRYLVRGVLGRGGMGVVYDGEHVQLGRSVAIKVLGAGIATDPIAIQRFLREARMASTLSHGNIVDVSDLGHLPDGRPYLVMPKMHGEDLCALLSRRGPQPPLRVVELLQGVAAALDLIHAKGFVHRDIKPENLMHVVREDGSEAVMLLDFGIAALVSPNAARLTAEGTLFGTPAYMPPEVVYGDLPDGRGDVYALTTVAFELMTGRLPFDSTNPIRILPMKMMANAPRMTIAGGRSFPDDIEDVIARGLDRDPTKRYQTAGELMLALKTATRAGSLQPRSRVTELASPGKIAAPPPIGVPKAAVHPTELEEALESLPPPLAAETDPQREIDTLSNTPMGVGHNTLVTVTASQRIDTPKQPKWKIAAVSAVVGLVLGLWLLIGSGPHDVQSKPLPAPTPVPLPTAASAAPKLDPMPTPVAAPEPAPTPSEPIAPQPTAATPEPAPQETGSDTQPKPTHPTPTPKPTGLKAPVTHELKPLPVQATKPAPVSAPTPTPEPAPKPATPAGPSANDLNKQAVVALVQGHPSQAADLYAQATKADPNNDAAWRGLGLMSEKLGRTQEALRAYKKALALAPGSAQAATIRARVEQLQAGK